jgi:hypothetical protein
MSLVRRLPRVLRKPFGFMYPNTHIDFIARAGGYEPFRDKSRVQRRGQEEYYEWLSGEESQVWDEKDIFPGRLHLSVCIGPNQHMPLVLKEDENKIGKVKEYVGKEKEKSIHLPITLSKECAEIVPARAECVSYQYDSAARAERMKPQKWTEKWMPLMLMATFGIILMLYFYVTIPSMAAMQSSVGASMSAAADKMVEVENKRLEIAKIEAGIIPGDIIVAYNGTQPP